MSMARQDLGLLGERIAARWLRRQGWLVRAHRFRCGHRDLDLVVQRALVIAFVEVKARRGTTFGSPIDAVHWRKRRSLIHSAQVWVSRFGRSGMRYQFDVLGVLITGNRVRVRHIPNAFGVE
jgi:putative endonuclease